MKQSNGTTKVVIMVNIMPIMHDKKCMYRVTEHSVYAGKIDELSIFYEDKPSMLENIARMTSQMPR